jgi:hypothetical protein
MLINKRMDAPTDSKNLVPFHFQLPIFKEMARKISPPIPIEE